MSRLDLELVDPEPNGARYLEFLIDGKSLLEIFGYDNGPSCLTFVYLDEELQKMLDSLLLRRQADFPDNRRPLYVCPQDGDLACGAATVIIEEHDDTIVWRDFGWENTYEDDVGIYEDIGPFTFNKTQYFQTLKTAISLLHS